MPKNKYYLLIKEKYQLKGGNYTELFKTICSISKEIGMNQALKYLEKCVIEKKLLWLRNNLNNIERSGNPIDGVLKVFYKIYLRISFGKNGKIVEKTDKKLIVRCWNSCPVLEACQKFGLDTRKICRGAYHKMVSVFISKIHPALRFKRNYNNIRPYSSYCEETIFLKK